MEIYVAKRAGFCFGVKRAVEIAFQTVNNSSQKVATLGPIIHNPQVVERLSKSGVKPVQEFDDTINTLIIRTHGIPAWLHNDLKSKKIHIIDATCPFVKKAQHYAKLLKEEGYQVVILGDGDHPEVQGILSYAGEEAIVVEDAKDLPRLKSRVGIVVQTTQLLDSLKKLLNRVIRTAKEVKVYNTICNSTALRLSETEEMARNVDLMLVVGGKNSANTKQLDALCREIGVMTYHIETTRELRKKWFRGIGKVGITAGASTPEWIIEGVVKKLSSMKN
jgi:4-hydroxy-3-methylbut-2-enyl diphosphate reductase